MRGFLTVLVGRLTAGRVIAGLALFIALGGGAYAASGGIPGSGGVITGCYGKQTGALRVIGASKHCRRKTEQRLVWNQAGPRGLQGVKGAQGVTGPQGIQGTQGVAGQPGLKGDQGSTGPTGPTEGTAADNYSRQATTLTPTVTTDDSSFTTTRPGHVLVIKSIDSFTPECNGQAGRVFLMVDGARVPGTVLDNVPSGTTLRGTTLSGVTPGVLAAGDHTAAIGLDCQGQSPVGTTTTLGEAVSAVVLG